MVFDKLIFKKDRILVGNLVFRLEGHNFEKNVQAVVEDKSDSWELSEECFILHKPRRMMDQYVAFWRSRPDFRPGKILELGILDGGSLALWFEHFRPEKIVGIDLSQRTDSNYFQRYVADGGRAGHIKTFWGIDQADRKRLRELVTQEFDGSLDLVVDDASHLFEQTKVSFETLFPLLRPAGLYIIEDWSWACWSRLPDGYLPVGTELPALIFQLVEATGSMDKYLVGEDSSQPIRPLIANLTVYPDFVVVERGDADTAPEGNLRLENCISRSPQLARVLKYPTIQVSRGRRSEGVSKSKKPWWRFW